MTNRYQSNTAQQLDAQQHHAPLYYEHNESNDFPNASNEIVNGSVHSSPHATKDENRLAIAPTAGPSVAPTADSNVGLCVVCLAQPYTHAYLPCMHRCVCVNCFDRERDPWLPITCPLCRSVSTKCVRVYDA